MDGSCSAEGPPGNGVPSSSAWVEKPLRGAGLWYFSRQSALEQEGGGEETPLPLPSSPVACSIPEDHVSSAPRLQEHAEGAAGREGESEGAMPARRPLNPSFLPARAACQGASVAGQPLPRSKLCPLCVPGKMSPPRCRVGTQRGFVGRPSGHPPGTARGETGPCSHFAHTAAAGAALAATHRQLRAPSHVYRSQQAGAAPLPLQAARPRVFPGGISSRFAPGRSAFSSETRSRDERPWLESSCRQRRGAPHTALGMAQGGCEAHAKPSSSGTGLSCSEPSAPLSCGHQPSAG